MVDKREAKRQGGGLKILAKECGYSLKRLANEVGVNYHSILRYNHGTMSPTIDVVIKIAIALNQPLKSVTASLGFDVTKIPDDIIYEFKPTGKRFKDLSQDLSIDELQDLG